MIVYVIKSPGGVEGVWTTPEAALKARSESGSRAQIVVRGTDLAEDTDEVKAARQDLIELKAQARDRELAKQLGEYRQTLKDRAPILGRLATELLGLLAVDPAGTFRREGVKGTTSAADCLIQRYLAANLPRPMGVRWYVNKKSATLLHGRYQIVWVELPDTVEEFRFQFDRGDFPDLFETN